MRPSNRTLAFLSCLTLSISVVVLSAPASSPSDLARVPLLIFRPPAETATVFNKTDQEYIDYAWRSFIALNWPAKKPLGGENRGQPDTSDGTYPGSTKPLVWETWPYTGQAFLPSGNWKKIPGYESTTDYPQWRQLPVRLSFPVTNQDGKITSYESPPASCLCEPGRTGGGAAPAGDQPTGRIHQARPGGSPLRSERILGALPGRPEPNVFRICPRS